MSRRVAASLGALALMLGAATAEPAANSPEAVVTRLYKRAILDQTAESPTSPFFEPTERRAYFSKGFDRLITTSGEAAARDGSALLDFDPISNSQDGEISRLAVETDHIDGERAVVSARFRNHEQLANVTYDLVNDGGEWRIDNIEGSSDKFAWSVRQLLDEAAKPVKDLPPGK